MEPTKALTWNTRATVNVHACVLPSVDKYISIMGDAAFFFSESKADCTV